MWQRIDRGRDQVRNRIDWRGWPPQEQALRLKQEIEACADAISLVHDAPELPTIPVRATSGLSRRGGYQPDRDADEDGRPLARHIAMSLEANTPRLTFAHEWGHYIDNWLTGFEGYACVETNALEQMLRDAYRTEALAQLRQIDQARDLPLPNRMEASRLLVPHEVLARAYAQYIALHSQDEIMNYEVALRRSDLMAPLAHLEYWEWSDFAGVAQSIDAFLKQKGWRP